MSTLYVVATPIGNLEDITLRALRVLGEVDLILCEDTRVTYKLLSHYGISKPTLSYHQHSKPEKMEYIFRLLQEGKNLALVCDAGTPGVSDPGNELIAFLLRESKNINNVRLQDISIVPVPGASAVSAAASIAGFPMERFTFLGYPPSKKGRKKFFGDLVQAKHPVIFYESPYRIVKTLVELQNTLDTKYKIQNTRLVVCRELTKKFETMYRGNIEEVINQLRQTLAKGEFVVIVHPLVLTNASTALSRSSLV